MTCQISPPILKGKRKPSQDMHPNGEWSTVAGIELKPNSSYYISSLVFLTRVQHTTSSPKEEAIEMASWVGQDFNLGVHLEREPKQGLIPKWIGLFEKSLVHAWRECQLAYYKRRKREGGKNTNCSGKKKRQEDESRCQPETRVSGRARPRRVD